MNRRQFLYSTSAAGLAIATPSILRAELAKDNEYRRNIGLQLYTLRKEIDKDVTGTMKAVAEAGYKQVEMYGFPSKTDGMLKAAKENGLAVNSTHFDWDCLVNPADDSLSEFKKVLEKAQSAGLKHLVVPYLADKNRGSVEAWKKVAAQLNKGAELAKPAGIRISYHNHSFEFKPLEGGKTGFDVLTEDLSKDAFFELDLFWVKVGGVEPLELMKKLTGRISQLHLKDVKPGTKIPEFGSLPPDAFQELGDGIISWEPILAAAKAAGVEHCHVEQDQSPDALASVKQSIGFLAKL